jgi:hypothetical protein
MYLQHECSNQIVDGKAIKNPYHASRPASSIFSGEYQRDGEPPMLPVGAQQDP